MDRGICAALTAAFALTACSGIKTYPNTLPKNLRVHATVSKVSAALHIYSVDARCQTDYQGTVQLDKPSVDVGIPAGRTILLSVTFFSSSFLRSSSSTTRHETLLTPRSGYSYDMKVSYVDDMYEVALREIDPHRSSSREIGRASPSGCKPS
jgi:hypothetical protein